MLQRKCEIFATLLRSKGQVEVFNLANYRTRAIISRGLYIFYPIFKDHFFVFKKVFSENSVLMYGLYSRAAYDGARTVYE